MASVLRCWARVLYDNGVDDILFCDEDALAADRSIENSFSEPALQDGWVVAANCEMLTPDIKHGQTYVRLSMDPFGCILLQHYVDSLSYCCLGDKKGSTEGKGYLNMIVVLAEQTPPANTNYFFSDATNGPNLRRRILAFELAYQTTNDVAARTIDVNLANRLGARPAGWDQSSAAIYYAMTQLALSADQDGVLGINQLGAYHNDNGTLVITDQSTDPSPFPYDVIEDTTVLALINIAIANAHVDDRVTAYLLAEEWLVL